MRSIVGLDKLSIGLLGRDGLPEPAQRALALVARAILAAGGTVVCAGSVVAPGPFLLDLFEGGDDGSTNSSGVHAAARDEASNDLIAPTTLGYGQRPAG